MTVEQSHQILFRPPTPRTSMMNTMVAFFFVSVFLFSSTSKLVVVAFRTTTIRSSSPLPHHNAAIGSIHRATPLLMSLSSSSNEKSKKEYGKPKSKMKNTKKKNAADTLILLKELDEKIDSYEGRLPSKMGSNIDDDNNEQTTVEDKEDVEQRQSQQHRCGFVGIVGAPNMGKSTILNALLKEDLCIATRRPQTTRHAILGVMSSPTRQCCLLDTPGVLEGDGAYKLQANMMEAVKGALKDSDVFLVVTGTLRSILMGFFGRCYRYFPFR
jgi:hypothetical protein